MPTEPKTETTVVTHDGTDGNDPKPASTPLGDQSAAKVSVSDGSSALDDLLKQAGGDPLNPDAPLPVKSEDDDEVETDEEKAAAETKRIADEKAIADKKVLDDAAGKPPVTDPLKPVDPPAVPPVEPDDAYAKIKPPPHSKPATTESFNALKKAAREEAAKLRTELEDAKKKIPTDGSAMTPELKKELDDLKAFRAAHDIQNTAEFVAAHVTPLQTNNETILAKLKSAGYTDEHIAKIKEIGLDKLDWEPVLAKLPTIARRAIEAKLLENETLNDKRAAAIAAAQKAPGEFTAKQAEAAKNAAKQADTETTAEIESVIGKVDWSKPKEVPAAATAAERTEIENFNKFVKEQSDRKAIMLEDRSPKMRGTLVAAALLAYQFMGQSQSWQKRAEEAEAELARVRKSSSTARRASNAPTTGLPAKNTSPLQSGKEALDAFQTEAAARD